MSHFGWFLAGLELLAVFVLFRFGCGEIRSSGVCEVMGLGTEYARRVVWFVSYKMRTARVVSL